MSKTTIDVRGDRTGDPWCHECPFWDAEWGTCAASLSRDTHANADGSNPSEGAPDWCPLRVGDVLVRLVGGLSSTRSREALKQAISNANHAGYQQAMADVLRMIGEAQMLVATSTGPMEQKARMATFSHMRAMVRARLNDERKRALRRRA